MDNYEEFMNNKIKPSPYIIYAQLIRPELKKQFPNVSFGEMGKIIRKSYNELIVNEYKYKLLLKCNENYDLSKSFDENTSNYKLDLVY